MTAARAGLAMVAIGSGVWATLVIVMVIWHIRNRGDQ